MASTDRPTLGRFELAAQLGSGVHGRVFLARDPRLDRKVALKVLTGNGRDRRAIERFLDEARAAARLAHPNVVPLYEAGSERGVPYLVFEYVAGRTLRERLKENPLVEFAEAMRWLRQILDGIAAAHALGIAHLDLAPNNVLIDERGNARIMDFGLARAVGGDGGARDAEATAGTPRYMSPEHYAGGPLDRRSDVFSLGLIAYELLAGRPAAAARKVVALRDTIEHGRFEWEPLAARGVAPELVAVLRDALAVEPARRPPDAGALRAAIDEALACIANPGSGDLTVQFLLRRLQRRPDFPAFSHCIAEVNRLTADDSAAGLAELSAAVLRDYGLTNRLMKVANSAYFDPGGTGVRTVSEAISRLGTRLVRTLCNGLIVFDQLRDERPVLEDVLVGSFVAGLLARDLCGEISCELAEEAFIAAMFHRLGHTLLIYYMEDEHDAIVRQVARGVPEAEAERAILGLRLSALGQTVATSWKFPAAIVASQAPLPPGVLPLPADRPEILRHLANLANEWCLLALQGGDGAADGAVALAGRYERFIDRPAAWFGERFAAALDTFVALAPSLGVDARTSNFCGRACNFRGALEAVDVAAGAVPA